MGSGKEWMLPEEIEAILTKALEAGGDDPEEVLKQIEVQAWLHKAEKVRQERHNFALRQKLPPVRRKLKGGLDP